MMERTFLSAVQVVLLIKTQLAALVALQKCLMCTILKMCGVIAHYGSCSGHYQQMEMFIGLTLSIRTHLTVLSVFRSLT